MALSSSQQAAVNRYLGIPAPIAGLPSMPSGAPPAQAPIVLPEQVIANTPPANPDAAALAQQLGFAPPAPRPPTAADVATAPAYDPSMGPITGVVGAPVAPPRTAGEAALRAQLPQGIGTGGPPSGAPPPAAPAGIVLPEQVSAAPPRPAPRGGGGPPAAPGPSWTAKRRQDEQDYLATFGAERAAHREVTDAAAVRSSEGAEAKAREARLVEEQAANEAAFQREAAQARDAYRAQTERAVAAVREEKVDPGRIFRDQGTWGLIATGIGGALAGLASGWNGRPGENSFVAMMDRAIDRDVASQEKAIAQKNANIQDRNSIYAQMLAGHRDDALARAQTRLAMIEATRTHAESEAQRLGTPLAQAQARIVDATLAREQAKAKTMVDAAEEQAAARAAAARAAAAIAARDYKDRRDDKHFEQGLKLDELDLERFKADKAAKAGKDKLPERFVATGKSDEAGNPVGYLARDATVAAKRTEARAQALKLEKLYSELLDLRNAEGTLGRATSRPSGSALGTPAWKTKAETLANKILLVEKEMDHLGVLSGSDERLETLGDVTAVDLIGDTTNDRLRARRDIIRGYASAETDAEAGTRVAKVVGPDGSERFVPLGGSNAPNNTREAARFSRDGTPQK